MATSNTIEVEAEVVTKKVEKDGTSWGHKVSTDRDCIDWEPAIVTTDS